ncbi:MAG: bifunctional glutamate N-acetyltransferase/amino-acid acetyltransferase ArgJ [Planctomycetes bacterium]|nr:bifunctional glutamate N-acetyltransferase/amino-acid acetyltransferase ArgJ [Planctomycetota bacterium]
MTPSVPQGFKLSGTHCGIKRNPGKPDLSIIMSDRPATAVGVFTQNLVHAAPVALDRQRTPTDRFRVLVINSGNANACTGDRGLADARQMATLAAAACGVEASHALVMSTGVIGEFLPLEKIEAGIRAASKQLGNSEESLVLGARGMLTTDTVHKLSGRTILVDGRSVQITGMAKGAAMIGPRMATMLSVIMTDAALEPATAKTLLTSIADETFNCISVDGHMSTNDTVLLLANGAAGTAPLTGESLATFGQALLEVCTELAKAIPNDGEGCTHLVTIDILGCADKAAARRIAKTVAESPLVKTAIAGADPNWGRIVSAAGYSGVAFDPGKVDLDVNGVRLYQQGSPLAFDKPAVAESIRSQRDTHVRLMFGEGEATARFWTTDLTPEYVRLNADYTT